MRKTTKWLLPFMGIILLSLLSAYAMAQTAIIRGIVKDASGSPLSGASVTVEPRNIGTITDALGAYSLKVPAGSYTLIISFVGQATQRIPVVAKAGETVEKNGVLTATGEGEAVRVVGSRTTRPRSIVTTPVPVDVISAKEIKQFPQADISQMLTYAVPSFQSTHQSVTDGTDHIDPASLRGLGPDQTLVLLNGKRRHNTALVNINGSVGRGSVGTDMNAIPAAAIERLEVLRDGAAAQYGSDAIAGVINVVLKKKFKGFSASTTFGGNITSMPMTTYYDGKSIKKNINDGFSRQVDFSAGTFSKKGAWVNLSGQFLGREQTNRSGEDNGPLQYLGTSASGFPIAPTASLPSTVASNSVVYRDWLMDQDKAIQVKRNYNRRNMIVGQSSSLNYTMFANAGLPLWKNTEAYLTTGIGYRSGQSEGNYRNPNSITQQPQTTSLTTLGLNSNYYVDGFLPQILTVIRDYSVLAGIKGKAIGWDWDLSNTWGTNSLEFSVANSGNATMTPSNSPQTSFYAGKQAFYQNTTNLDIDRTFDFGNKKSLNLAFGGESRHEIFVIQAGEDASWNSGTFTSDSVIVPAYTGGTSYVLKGATVPGAQVFPGFRPANVLNKTRNVYAGYVDLEAVLGKLTVGAAGRYESYHETSANITYNGSGLKASALYNFISNFSIRGSVGTGFRAPSLHQRYFNNISTQFVNGNPQNSLTASNQDAVVRNSFGINELKPEKSTDYTLGLVGKFGKGWTVTIDGYLINIKDRIVLSSAFNYFNTNPDSTKYKTPTQLIFQSSGINPNTSASSLQFWTNAIDTRTTGIDAVISNRFRTGAKSYLSVTLAANFNKNEVTSLHVNPTIDGAANNPSQADPTNNNPANDLRNILFDRQQRARIETGTPNNKINLTAIYSIGKFDVLARAVRFGKVTELASQSNNPYATKTDGTYWNDVAFGADQTFSAKVTTDLVITYKPASGVGISIGANNLFDVYPDKIFIDPRNSYASVYAAPTNASVTTSKATTGYNSSRDQSNRGRFLFTANQFGYNGRYVFGRLTLDFGLLSKKK